MTFSSVWLFHLYEVFLRMGFARGFCPWVLFVGFAREFSSVSFARGFSSVSFHL
jgi:hypothetical protein